MRKFESYHRVLESIMSLSLLNLLNMVLPLITLPYLIRVVGIANYGKYSIVYVMIQYVILIASYGFNFSATRLIAMNREDRNEIETIFNSVLLCKILLTVFPSILFLVFSWLVYDVDYVIMLALGLGMAIGDIFNPVWLYQGMEKMRYMTIVNFISKLFFTVLIFILIRKKSDYLFITLYNSAGYLLAGAISLYIACHEFHLSLKFPNKESVIFQFKDGLYIFLSTVFMNLYRNSNTFILGLFVNESFVGMYAGAEKIVKAVQSSADPISNAFFPHLAESFKHHTLQANILQLFKLTKILFLFLLVLGSLCFFFAPLLNRMLLDANEEGSILLIKLMSPVIIVGGLNYVLGIVGLINLGEKRKFLQTVFVSGILSVTFLLCTVRYWGASSAALSMVLAEITIFVCCLYYLRKLYGCSYPC